MKPGDRGDISGLKVPDMGEGKFENAVASSGMVTGLGVGHSDDTAVDGVKPPRSGTER